MGVMMQAFYWNAPQLEGQEGTWWDSVQARVPQLAVDGFTALWLPPVSKAAEWNSMGYDPYDYFDLGEYNQKGNPNTWFGTRSSLTALIAAAHAQHLQVYADLVLSHNSGGDAQEVNPIDGETRWTQFKPASGQFARDWTCFHPSSYETMDGFPAFGGMPHLCHRNPAVYGAVMRYAQWLIETIGFDGFRFDFVKGYGPWLAKGIAEYRYRGGASPKIFCVGECWDSDRTINDWLDAANTFMDNPLSAFDFPLHYQLKGLCDSYGFDLRGLTSGTLISEQPDRAVTFVDNHDTARDPGSAVINDKLLAYAIILTHQGYPCVFWQDYFNFGLARNGTGLGISALIAAHERFAGGDASVLYADANLYVYQRGGYANQPGLILVVNNRGDSWQGERVNSCWTQARLQPIAWSSAIDSSRPNDQWSDAQGTVELWAAPRGYAVYAPQ